MEVLALGLLELSSGKWITMATKSLTLKSSLKLSTLMGNLYLKILTNFRIFPKIIEVQAPMKYYDID